MFNGSYPKPEDKDWLQYLLSEGQIKSLPVDVTIDEDFDCASAGTTMENELGEKITITWSKQNGYCYGRDENGNIAIIYTPLESEAEKANCANGTAYYVWTSTGKEGTYCDPFGTIDTIVPPTPTPTSTTVYPSPTPIGAPTTTPKPTATPNLTPSATPNPSSIPSSTPTVTPTPMHHPIGAINGPSKIVINQNGTFNATINDVDGNLSMIYIEIEGPPKGTQNWKILTSPACNGSSCSAGYTWTPTESGQYTVIVRGIDNTNLGCSGNPYITYPNGIYTSCGNADALIVTVTAPTYSLTVNKTGTGTGTVTSAPAGINCGTTCVSNFSEDYFVLLTAVPNSNSQFNSWTGCTSSSGNTCAVLMSAKKTVTANFTAAAPTSKVLLITGKGSQDHCIVNRPYCGCNSQYGSYGYGTLNNDGENLFSTVELINSGADCFSDSGTVQESSFKFEPLTDIKVAITRVHLSAMGYGLGGYAAMGNIYFRNLSINYYAGGSNWHNNTFPLPTGGGIMEWDWTVNPATNQPWEPEDFTYSEFGVLGNCGNNGMGFNRLALRVYYTAL